MKLSGRQAVVKLEVLYSGRRFAARDGSNRVIGRNEKSGPVPPDQGDLKRQRSAEAVSAPDPHALGSSLSSPLRGPLSPSRVPRTLAFAGIAIGFAFMVMWWYIVTYDPFHLPTAEAPSSYSAPALYWLLKDSIFVLCPGEIMGVFCMDCTGYTVPLLIWTVAALLNGPIYYCLGLLIVNVTNRLRGAPAS